MAMMFSAKLMFNWFGEIEMANKLENTIAKVIAEGKVITYDMGENSITLEVAEEVTCNL